MSFLCEFLTSQGRPFSGKVKVPFSSTAPVKLPALGRKEHGHKQRILALSYTSSFESYVSNSDVSGDGIWQTGVNYKAFVVRSGGTSSYSTGPSSAYAGSYYAYCETSSPNNPAANFALQTTEFSDGISSVAFHYNAYGATIGTVSLQGSRRVGNYK